MVCFQLVEKVDLDGKCPHGLRPKSSMRKSWYLTNASACNTHADNCQPAEVLKVIAGGTLRVVDKV